MTTFNIGKYSAAHVHDLCQHLAGLGMSKGQEHLGLLIDSQYRAKTGQVVHVPVCVARPKTFCSFFLKPPCKRLKTVFDHTVQFLQAHEKELSDKQFVEKNIVALTHFEVFFSTKATVKANLIHNLIAKLKQPSVNPLDTATAVSIALAKEKLKDVKKNASIAIQELQQKCLADEQAAHKDFYTEKMITGQMMLKAYTLKAVPIESSASIKSTHLFHSLYEQEADKDVVFEPGKIKVHSSLLKHVMTNTALAQKSSIKIDSTDQWTVKTLVQRLYLFDSPTLNVKELYTMYLLCRHLTIKDLEDFYSSQILHIAKSKPNVDTIYELLVINHEFNLITSSEFTDALQEEMDKLLSTSTIFDLFKKITDKQSDIKFDLITKLISRLNYYQTKMLACTLADNKNFKKLLKEMGDNPYAQYLLGMIYFFGKEQAKRKKGIELIRKADVAGNWMARLASGDILLHGINGVQKDQISACEKLFSLAGDPNHKEVREYLIDLFDSNGVVYDSHIDVTIIWLKNWAEDKYKNIASRTTAYLYLASCFFIHYEEYETALKYCLEAYELNKQKATPILEKFMAELNAKAIKDPKVREVLIRYFYDNRYDKSKLALADQVTIVWLQIAIDEETTVMPSYKSEYLMGFFIYHGIAGETPNPSLGKKIMQKALEKAKKNNLYEANEFEAELATL